MLSKEKLDSNKQEILDLIDKIERPFDKEAFIKMLTEQSDFFTAPASSKYNNSFIGGLCDHTLNVYHTLKMLVEQLGLSDIISYESVIIVSLCHDFAKINYYEKAYKNQKVYCDSGSKKDGNGNFDWVTIEGYRIKEPKDRFLYSNHELNSEYITKTYIPLSTEESAAITNHHGGMAFDSCKDIGTILEVYKRYPLACLLHVADIISTVLETPYE